MKLQLPVEFAIAFLLVFARTGGMLMLLPMIGERFIPVRARLVFALFLSLLLLLPLKPALSGAAASGNGVFGVLFVELLIGLGLGLMVRMLLVAADMASQFIAQSLGLSLGEILNPTYESQSTALGMFLSLLLVTFLFLTDAHQAVIGAIAGSYAALPPGGGFETGDVSHLAVEAAGNGMVLAFKIAAPFFAFGMLFNAGLGMVSKLMPQIQVTFLAVPLSVLAGFGLLIVLLGALVDRLSVDILGMLARLTGG
jgi:flagellar biosynthetic protein FliR